MHFDPEYQSPPNLYCGTITSRRSNVRDYRARSTSKFGPYVLYIPPQISATYEKVVFLWYNSLIRYRVDIPNEKK